MILKILQFNGNSMQHLKTCDTCFYNWPFFPFHSPFIHSFPLAYLSNVSPSPPPPPMSYTLTHMDTYACVSMNGTFIYLLV